MQRDASTDGVHAARSVGVVYCIIGAAGMAASMALSKPDTVAFEAFRWLLLASCFGFLVIGVVLLVLAGIRAPSAGDGIPTWIGPTVIVGGVLLCLGLLGTLVSMAVHPALWVPLGAIGSIMVSMQLFGLAAGVYRIHGGKRVG